MHAEAAPSFTASDQITVKQYVLTLLKRIRQRDAAVKAWAYLDEALVLARAEELDALPGNQRGPLHGLVVAGGMHLLHGMPASLQTNEHLLLFQ